MGAGSWEMGDGGTGRLGDWVILVRDLSITTVKRQRIYTQIIKKIRAITILTPHSLLLTLPPPYSLVFPIK